MKKYKVVIPTYIRPRALMMLGDACEIRQWTGQQAIPQETLYGWLADAEGLFMTGHGVQVDADLLAHAPALRVIAQAAAGFDNTDIAACTRAGVPFSNTPGVVKYFRCTGINGLDTIPDPMRGLPFMACRVGNQ